MTVFNLDVPFHFPGLLPLTLTGSVRTPGNRREQAVRGLYKPDLSGVIAALEWQSY